MTSSFDGWGDWRDLSELLRSGLDWTCETRIVKPRLEKHGEVNHGLENHGLKRRPVKSTN